ncbi:MAG: hypothetical protein ABR514_07350 [Chthoniobacterales bacterium]
MESFQLELQWLEHKTERLNWETDRLNYKAEWLEQQVERRDYKTEWTCARSTNRTRRRPATGRWLQVKRAVLIR